MNKEVIHHTYSQGIAWDVSKNFNHGKLVDVDPVNNATALSFVKNSSKVTVKKSQSLEDLRSIRVKIEFLGMPNVFDIISTDPSHVRRYYLVDADQSFQVFITNTGMVWGNVMDVNGKWHETNTSMLVIQPNIWYSLEFSYDGISCAKIFVNGILVASRYDIRAGGVPSIGTNGIIIGNTHRPYPTFFPLVGQLREFELWKYDDEDLFKSLIDPCCAKNTDWDAILDDLEKRKIDKNQLFELSRKMQNTINNFIAKARHDSPAGIEAQETVNMEFLMALLSHNKSKISAAFDKATQWGQQWIDPKDYEPFLKEIQDILEHSPYNTEELLKLADQTCFGDLADALREKSLASQKQMPKKPSDKKDMEEK